jgi:hypothetical protein
MKTMALTVLVAAFATGCYTTTIRSGKPVGDAPLVMDEKWHSGFLSGTQEASGPYDLDEVCPHGWAEITTKTSFANGLVEMGTFHIYNPQTVEVKCAAEPTASK